MSINGFDYMELARRLAVIGPARRSARDKTRPRQLYVHPAFRELVDGLRGVGPNRGGTLRPGRFDQVVE
jgi:hypothetical protein